MENFKTNSNNGLKTAIDIALEKTPQSTIPQIRFEDFLLEQILLPEEERSIDFNNYLNLKIRKKDILSNETLSKEGEIESTFQRYLKGLKLTEGQLKDKKILDVGCGTEADFIQAIVKKRITDDVFGVDLSIDGNLTKNEPKRYFKTDFSEPPELRDVDYIISLGALSLDDDATDLNKNLSSLIPLLSKVGEIRIYPLRIAPEGSDLTGIIESRKKWIEKLNELKDKFNIEYKFNSIDIRVSGDDNDLWLDEVLIIRNRMD
jgi:SAM-dependent methyltransferase